MELVKHAIDGGIATVTLNNPPLNLVTLELTRQLNETVARLAVDPAVLVLVLTGSGDKAFCAGSDIKEFPDMMAAGAVVPRKLALENEAWNRIDDFPKPTIAALNGLAFGGGLELAMCCDLIVAEAGQFVALPEIKLGVFPGTGGTVRAMRRIGEARAKEMMFFGEKLPVETALDWGLLNRVVPKGRALATATEMARTLDPAPQRGAAAAQAERRDGLRHVGAHRGACLAVVERQGVLVGGLRRGREGLLRQARAGVPAQVTAAPAMLLSSIEFRKRLQIST
jgi:enoyl-CoA hydratase/carnithine racemase